MNDVLFFQLAAHWKTSPFVLTVVVRLQSVLFMTTAFAHLIVLFPGNAVRMWKTICNA